MRKEYTIPMDRSAKVLTCFAIFLGIAVPTFLLFCTENPFISLSLLIFISSLYLLCFLLAPVKVVIDERGIEIKKRAGSVFIPFSEVKNVFLTEFRGIRIFGSGGLFGFFGNDSIRAGDCQNAAAAASIQNFFVLLDQPRSTS